ncbi:MAG: sn-glycerol-3-phosphate ABC transporter permease UgpE [Rhodospirillales bacterium]|jgi:sn-glycerol 3-phosphate transport system permease protein|nr:sn-glycerol-3-phosphate ABC transporter permease UgpE [Rhodospirillales bacterium]
MVENRRWLTLLTHAVLLLGVAILAFPIWIAFVASTHQLQTLLQPPMPLLPGGEFFENYYKALTEGARAVGAPVWLMMANSLVMALGITFGKIVISMLAAFAIVYFRFRFRMFFFWMIFITLMLPVEVRILPTYKVVSDLGMLDNYFGLTIPLIASATATFLFRQFFMTVPDELSEAARVDGAGPMRFFKDILFPMSRTNIAALFVILFIYGWNQYLWPLLITTDESMYTMLIGINRMLAVGDDQAEWQIIMATTMLAMLPPVAVVVLMQKLFVQGMTETEK